MMNQNFPFSEPEAFGVLEPLLSQKPFHALSPDEQAQVLTWVSESEYQQMRKVLLKAAHCLPGEITGLHAKPETLSKLKARLQAQQPTPKPNINTWRRFFLQPVPVYKAAAAVLLVSLGVHVSHVQLNQHTPTKLPYPIMADTSQIFQERGFSNPEEDTVITTLVRELQR